MEACACSGLMVYSTNYTQDGATTNNREFGGSASSPALSPSRSKDRNQFLVGKIHRADIGHHHHAGGGNQFTARSRSPIRNNVRACGRPRQDRAEVASSMVPR